MEYVKATAAIIIFLYLTIFVVCMMFGIQDSGKRACYKQTRIELAFPAYKLGCWLGEEV